MAGPSLTRAQGELGAVDPPPPPDPQSPFSLLSLFCRGGGGAAASPAAKEKEGEGSDTPPAPGTPGTPNGGATSLAQLLAENAALLAELRTGTTTAEMCLRAEKLSAQIKTLSVEKGARKSKTKARTMNPIRIVPQFLVCCLALPLARVLVTVQSQSVLYRALFPLRVRVLFASNRVLSRFPLQLNCQPPRPRNHSTLSCFPFQRTCRPALRLAYPDTRVSQETIVSQDAAAEAARRKRRDTAHKLADIRAVAELVRGAEEAGSARCHLPRPRHVIDTHFEPSCIELNGIL